MDYGKLHINPPVTLVPSRATRTNDPENSQGKDERPRPFSVIMRDLQEGSYIILGLGFIMLAPLFLLLFGPLPPALVIFLVLPAVVGASLVVLALPVLLVTTVYYNFNNGFPGEGDFPSLFE